MEQLEVINKIKIQEEQAQRIIEQARFKAASMVKQAKFTKREEILRAAREEALAQAQRIKEEVKLQIQASLKQQEQQTQQNIDRINALASKTKHRARDYIVDEVLKRWQLQR